ncbi:MULTISPECIES: DUF2958 domain-containing protein [Delftia]|uniref:DUF2958 domain-containing protein n=1 Tax=Delftia lacustris TaxID=558537 RepID=A0A7T2YW22_9BURK|nr:MULTISPECIES: DUF2958 domain-containing protein [Delftia]EPD42360.1 hypothetical protein HMPREF9702_02550 [Delftia acidovorans CCUG 15835]QPS83109.1 DUF2958 domain-containing protein [Delftia lacustris]
MPQLLTTAPERAQLLANGEARVAGRAIDPVPVVRLFTPDANVTWLLAALDPADGDTAWGLIDLGLGMPAQGTVKLSELAGIVGPRQQPVMRDLYFRPTRTLSEYARLAEQDGVIPD